MIVTMCMENADPSRCMNFEWDPLRLIVYPGNRKIMSWFRNLKLTSSYETTSLSHAPKLRRVKLKVYSYACEPH